MNYPFNKNKMRMGIPIIISVLFIYLCQYFIQSIDSFKLENKYYYWFSKCSYVNLIPVIFLKTRHIFLPLTCHVFSHNVSFQKQIQCLRENDFNPNFKILETRLVAQLITDFPCGKSMLDKIHQTI